MPRTHTPYAAEYRRRVVELARAGRSVTALAREFRTVGRDHPPVGHSKQNSTKVAAQRWLNPAQANERGTQSVAPRTEPGVA